MFGDLPHRATVLVALFSQLLLLLGGGPLIVQCQGADGHREIEVAHVGPCGEESSPDSECDGGVASKAGLEWTHGGCVDTGMEQPPVLSQKDRVASLPAALLRAYHGLDGGDARFCVARAGFHVSSPGLAAGVDRGVILLI